jgi:hypothetical protein
MDVLEIISHWPLVDDGSLVGDGRIVMELAVTARPKADLVRPIILVYEDTYQRVPEGQQAGESRA